MENDSDMIYEEAFPQQQHHIDDEDEDEEPITAKKVFLI